MRSSIQIVTVNKPAPSILQAGCPSCCQTNGVKALKGKSITFHGLVHPKLTCGLATLSSNTKGGYLVTRGGLPNLSNGRICILYMQVTNKDTADKHTHWHLALLANVLPAAFEMTAFCLQRCQTSAAVHPQHRNTAHRLWQTAPLQ